MLPSRRLQLLIREKEMTYVQLEEKTGIAKSSIQRYASGVTKKIPVEAVEKLAVALSSTPGFIMGWGENQSSYTEQWEAILTKENERSIEKELQAMLNDIDEKGHFTAYGGKSPKEMSEKEFENHILFKNALRETLKIAKRINKEKHTPHKYRKGDN